MYVILLNAEDDGAVAKTILAGCYKFGFATLLMWGGSTMTCVAEVYGEDLDD